MMIIKLVHVKHKEDILLLGLLGKYNIIQLHGTLTSKLRLLWPLIRFMGFRLHLLLNISQKISFL